MAKKDTGSWAWTSIIRKDFRRDFSDGDDEARHVKAATRKAPKKKPGCPQNDGGPHVYVWVQYERYVDWGYREPRVVTFERKTCCGCLKKASHSPRGGWKRRRVNRRDVSRIVSERLATEEDKRRYRIGELDYSWW